MRSVELRDNSFVQKSLLDAVRIQKSLEDADPVKVSPKYKRDPNEHEFYVIGVGHAVAELLTACDQIEQTVAYMASYANKKTLSAAGVTRHGYLLYHIENHIIRTHSLYDRVLLLIDAVFHLLNAREECIHKVIVGNLRVAKTSIPGKLKAIRKLLTKTIDLRNSVIHHESFKDDSLRELEMYCIYQSLPSDAGIVSVSQRWISRRINQLSRKLISNKRAEFEKLNSSLFSGLVELFSALTPYYAKELKLVELRANA